jgi:energy-coupling factor transporter ATP-binding protein EcfA2
MEAPDGIALSGVCKSFTGRGRVVEALRDVTLTCPQGSFTAIIGPSGCGKSTAMRIAMGLGTADKPEMSALRVKTPLAGRPRGTDRHRLSGRRPAALAQRAAQCRGAARGAAPTSATASSEHVQHLIDLVGLKRFRKRASGRAFGGNAATGGDSTRARHASAGPVHGRTLRRARPDSTPPDELGASAHLDRERLDRSSGNAWNRRGGIPGRPGGGDARRPGPDRRT